MVYYEQENFRKDGQYHEKNHSLCSSRLFVCRDHDASGDTGAGERAPSVAALVDPLLSGDSGNQRAGRCLDQAGKTGSCNCTVRKMLTGGFGPRFLQAAAMDPVQRTGAFPDFAFSVSRPAACPEEEPNDRIKAACNCPAFYDIVAGRRHDNSPAYQR